MTATLYKGSTSSFEAAQSAAVYEAVLTELGATGTIVPLGDPTYRTGATTNTCAAGVTGLPTAVFTASEALESFDIPPTRQGICPVVTFNGSDEDIVSSDDSYWSPTNNAFSVGGWFWLDSAAGGTDMLMAKRTSGQNEWSLENVAVSGDLIQLWLYDQSTVTAVRAYSGSAPTDQWVHIISTYDGAANASGIVIYLNGASQSLTVVNDGSFTAMENKTGDMAIGSESDNPTYLGKVGGGCVGPIYTKIELTAEQVMNLYRIGKGALAL